MVRYSTSTTAGQYTGRGRPDPSAHAHISSFGPDILVLRSLRQPKRITVRADNEKVGLHARYCFFIFFYMYKIKRKENEGIRTLG
jgi:hypothetical protein